MSLRKVKSVSKRYQSIGVQMLGVIAVLTCSQSQADETDLVSSKLNKQSPEAPRCYRSEYTVDEYKTVKENRISKEASSTFKITNPSFEQTSTSVKVKDGYSEYTVTQTVFQDKPVSVQMQDGRVDIEVTSAEFDTTTEKVLVQEGYTKLELIPETYKTVEKAQLVKEA